MHAIAVVILFLGAIVITAVIFLVWLLLTVLRGLTRMLLGPGLKPRAVAAPQALPGGQTSNRRCPRESCKALNAGEARFCRRCGQNFEKSALAPVRRVALL